MSRAAPNLPRLQWFAPSALRRHGWGERRIRDAWERASPEHWRGYPQLEVSAVDRTNPTTKMDCEADTVTVLRIGGGSAGIAIWEERIEELALLLPADANGAPLASDQEVIASTAPNRQSTTAIASPLPTKAWVIHAIEQCREELADLSVRAAAQLLETWMRDGKGGLRAPQKTIGWSRIKTIATEQGLLPIRSASK